MNTQHTPGPLEARQINHDHRPFAVISPNGPHGDLIVAGFCTEADAILYAAAPYLLAACVEFVRKVDAGEARSKRSYAAMKAAIAKATGQ
jgi:hypothetical protein